jgi:hypothetical protein
MARRDKRGSFYIVLHVEECYGVEHPRDVKVAIKQISGHFNLKIENELLDYVSCEICFDRNKEKAWLSQPSHLLKKMEEKIGKMVQSNQTYRSPGTPGGFGIRSLKEDDKAISREDQTFHRSGVGMVLYLVKHTRPDISNVVRELSKILSWATEAAFKELKRVIKFVLDTKTFGLKVEPKMDKEKCELGPDGVHALDWAGDKDDRRSITGYMVCLLGAPILWKSKAQISVSLSSSETEYYALSEAGKEIKFVVQILLSMGIPVKIPVVDRVDNMGAIFMSENASASSRTKHVHSISFRA